MAWVQLDPGFNVIAIYGGPQPGNNAVTVIADNDPRIAAFLAPGKPQFLTSTQFFNRFTDAERTAIFSAAQASPQMLQFVVTAAAATQIDLADPAVQDGVNSLIGGILTAPRAAEILDH